MSDVKTMVFPEMGSGSNGLESALLSNGGGGMWNNPIWALVFLAFLGRNGIWGGNGDNNCQLSQIQSTLNTNQGQQLLMDAIKGNNVAIHKLADASSEVRRCGLNVGLTYSVRSMRNTIMMIGLQDDVSEFVNTLRHEQHHIISHICQADEVDMKSENAAYVAGDVGQAMYDCLRRVNVL